ncbi:MAG TPA: hypothetical protein VF627_04240 [Abditibacterium sp.]|jgi:hypothetical protein
MLNFIQLNRAFSALIAAGVLVLFLAVRMFLASQPVPVGEFILPAMSGWSREVKDKGERRQVLYHSHVRGNRLSINLSYEPPGAKPPQTLQTLQSEFADGRALIGSLAAKHGLNSPGMGAATYQPTTINGLPAVLVKENWGGTSRTTLKSLLVVKGVNAYVIISSVTVPTGLPSFPDADNQLEDAWQKLTNLIR